MKNDMIEVKTKSVRTSYDQVPYISMPYKGSHPDHLATLAQLFGMKPAKVTRCKVLELGCAGGGNLIPMAQYYPHSEFIGIDLSREQVREANSVIRELDLQNITIEQMDLTAFDGEIGEFDFIIAHGIFSWVPYAVQESIFEICSKCLSPNGVAFISYNTFPGWHLRGMVRDLMLYHTRDSVTPEDRIGKSKGFLRFLTENLASGNEPYPHFLKEELVRLEERSDSYLYHEHLEENNTPIYFFQFIDRARQHGLQYLSESEFFSMLPTNMAPPLAEAVRSFGNNLIEMEQYMDFIHNRTFRQTLLCHGNIKLNRTLTADSLQSLSIASPLQPAGDSIDLRSPSSEDFSAPNEKILSTSHPLTKAALVFLSQVWPQPIPFADLLSTSNSLVYGNGNGQPIIRDAESMAQDTFALGGNILDAYAGNLLELHTDIGKIAVEVSERPEASPLARRQAGKGRVVTNRRHESIQLDEFKRQLIILLDGENTREMLVEKVLKLVSDGLLVVLKDKNMAKQFGQQREMVVSAIDKSLQDMSRSALLVS